MGRNLCGHRAQKALDCSCGELAFFLVGSLCIPGCVVLTDADCPGVGGGVTRCPSPLICDVGHSIGPLVVVALVVITVVTAHLAIVAVLVFVSAFVVLVFAVPVFVVLIFAVPVFALPVFAFAFAVLVFAVFIFAVPVPFPIVVVVTTLVPVCISCIPISLSLVAVNEFSIPPTVDALSILITLAGCFTLIAIGRFVVGRFSILVAFAVLVALARTALGVTIFVAFALALVFVGCREFWGIGNMAWSLVGSALAGVRGLDGRWGHPGGGTRARGWRHADAALLEHKLSPRQV